MVAIAVETTQTPARIQPIGFPPLFAPKRERGRIEPTLYVTAKKGRRRAIGRIRVRKQLKM